MTTPTTRGRRIPTRTRKSPLAAPGHAAQADAVTAASALAASVRSPLTDRESTLAEFEGYLRTVNNRDGRPYEEKTISVYSVPAKNLDGWLTANGIEGDFMVIDPPLLNRYFREYYLEHVQGGTHTPQRNLIQLFNFLERERGFASPYTDGLNRYAAVKGRPKTLSGEFVDDLLAVTGSGRARDFETARDHAIIRILRSEGIRRAELLRMVMSTLPADVIKNPVFRLVPLKGARATGEGRLVVLAPTSARAPAIYLRARRDHPLAGSDWVWLGAHGRGRFQNTGIRKMLIRRAEQQQPAALAQRDPPVPQSFRDDLLDHAVAEMRFQDAEADQVRQPRVRLHGAVPPHERRRGQDGHGEYRLLARLRRRPGHGHRPGTANPQASGRHCHHPRRRPRERDLPGTNCGISGQKTKLHPGTPR
jgi:integrase/recombinase XerD